MEKQASLKRISPLENKKTQKLTHLEIFVTAGYFVNGGSRNRNKVEANGV